MKEWKNVKLGEICEITSSKRIFFSEYVDSGIPFYRSKEIIELSQGQSISEPLYISESRYNEIRQRFGAPEKNDILLTSVGSIGIPYIVNKTDKFYFKDGNLTWFRNYKDSVFPLYILYWLRTNDCFNILNNIALGAAQKALTIVKLKEVKIPLPSLSIQHRITAILSRYDSLIENYQKQIKLLEESAQRLYKEWFIDLRFPGHENTKIVDGVPEGWKKKKAMDFFTMSIGKTPPRAEKEWFTKSPSDVPWVSISDMKDIMFVNETNEHLTKEACEKFNVKIVPNGTILLSFKLTVGRVSLADIPVCTNEAIAHFRKDGTNWREYTLFYLRAFNYDSLGNTSGISKAVNSTIIKNMPFLMPSEFVLNAFSDMVTSTFNNIRNLSSQIRNLTEARDRLLPKFMNGEIEV